MKTIILSIAFILSISVIFAGNDPIKRQSNEKQLKVAAEASSDKAMNDGGFFLNVGLFMPSAKCYIPLAFNGTAFGTSQPGINLELGNMFKIVKLDDNAIGIKASWLDASYSGRKNGNTKAAYLQGSVVRVGPYFTYSISDEMAVDGFYQIGATYVLDLNTDTALSGRTNSGYLGATHNLGACFRYKVFSAGFDFGFGNVKYLDKEEYNFLDIKDFYTIRTSHFRLFVGFKF